MTIFFVQVTHYLIIPTEASAPSMTTMMGFLLTTVPKNITAPGGTSDVIVQIWMVSTSMGQWMRVCPPGEWVGQRGQGSTIHWNMSRWRSKVRWQVCLPTPVTQTLWLRRLQHEVHYYYYYRKEHKQCFCKSATIFWGIISTVALALLIINDLTHFLNATETALSRSYRNVWVRRFP